MTPTTAMPVQKIPSEWKLELLGNISEIIVPMRNKPKEFDGETPWIRIEDLEGKYVYGSKSNQKVSQRTIKNMSLKPYPVGTVLCSCSGNMGICAITKSILVSNQTFAGIVPNEKLNSDYLYYLLTFYRPKLESMGSGTTIRYLSREKFESLPVIIPPFHEMNRIATILSKSDELTKKTDQIIDHTKRLKKGLMQRLLTKGIGHDEFHDTAIGNIPASWTISTIGEEFDVGSGGTPSRQNPNYFKGNIPWVKTTELNYNCIVDTEEKITEDAIRNSSAKIYPKGTFVLAMIGLEAGKTMGRCAILGIDAAVNQACATLQTRGNLTVSFIYYYYQTLKKKIVSIMAGTKRMNLNLELV